MKKKVIITVLVVVCIAGGIGIMRMKSAANKDIGVPVTAKAVKNEQVITKINVDGEVKLRDKNIVTANNNAKIKSVAVKEGDHVKAGQVLVIYDEEALDDLKNQLDDAKIAVQASEVSLQSTMLPAEEDEIKQCQNEILQAEKNIESVNYRLEQLEISMEQARLNMDTAQKDYDNNKVLYDNKVISRSEYEEYENKLKDSKLAYNNLQSQYKAEQLSLGTEESNLELANTKYNTLLNKTNTKTNQNAIEAQRVQLEQAKLKVSQLQAEINKFKLQEIAAVDGTVVSLNVDEGEYVAEGQALMEIADIEHVVVEVQIPEYDMEEVQPGQEAILTGDGFKGEIKGELSKIYPIAEEKTISGSTKQVITAEIEAENPELLKAGYTLEADIITNIRDNANVIPIMAYLTDNEGKDFVYVLKEDSTLEKRYIDILTYSNNNVAVSGVNAGEKVIDNPSEDLLFDGVAVNATEEE